MRGRGIDLDRVVYAQSVDKDGNIVIATRMPEEAPVRNPEPEPTPSGFNPADTMDAIDAVAESYGGLLAKLQAVGYTRDEAAKLVLETQAQTTAAAQADAAHAQVEVAKAMRRSPWF